MASPRSGRSDGRPGHTSDPGRSRASHRRPAASQPAQPKSCPSGSAARLVLGAWLAKESVRAVYLDDDPDAAAVLLDTAIDACRSDAVPEIRTLGRTLSRWSEEILNH